MKNFKKLLVVLLALIMVLSLAIFTACEEVPGPAGPAGVAGPAGADGENAYELYCEEYGYTGTMEQWLEAIANGTLWEDTFPVETSYGFIDKSDLPLTGSLKGHTVILHTNDSHSRVHYSDGKYDGFHGMDKVAYLKYIYEAAGAEVLVMDAGDTLHGLPVANVSEGENIVDVLNAVGYDYMTAGNHDFNYGTDRLIELEDMMDTQLLIANYEKTDDHTKPFKTHDIIELNGKKIGIFGLATEETLFKSHPDNTEGYTFLDNVDTANTMIDTLKAEGAEYIICLAHLGLDASSGDLTSKYLAENAKEGIDLIIDGHSHTKTDEATIFNGINIVSAGDYLRNIGVVILDEDMNLTNANLFKDMSVYGDSAVKAEVDAKLEATETALAVVVGNTPVVLDGEERNARFRETNLGNLSADAMRYASGADIAFTNGGGIRASIDAGDVTKKDLVTVFPFGNFVVTKEVTAEGVKAILEHSVSKSPESNGAFAQISGMKFTYDISKDAGSRVVELTIGETVYIEDGEWVGDKATKFVLATNDFLAAGGDGYAMLKNFEDVGNFSALEEVMIAYFEYLGTLADGKFAEMYTGPVGRITQIGDGE